MKIPNCDREQEVVNALVSGRWTSAWGEEIRQHAATCSVCREVAFVAEALRAEAEAADHVRLPGAGLVWWKAQLAARRAAEERAAQPITLVERAAQALSALAAFGLVAWQWPRITSWFGTTRSLVRPVAAPANADWVHHLAQGVAQAWPVQSPGFLVIVSIGAFLTVTGFAAYVTWREE
ncbi:MAG: hypothetical protein ACRD3T_19885 [Terriglobia bacterium]